MSIATFRVKQPRPTKLSDPFDDHSSEWLDEILAIPDDAMGWREYQSLLGPILPAGNYEESVYFLPGAFRFLVSHDETEIEFVADAIIGFVSKNSDSLKQDGILAETLACIRECLDTWTQKFEGREVLEEVLEPEIIPPAKNAQSIIAATENLVKFEKHTDIAVSFVQSLADHGSDITKAAWFLEYSRLQAYDFWAPPDYPPIRALINDTERLRHASEVVKPLAESSPHYWQTVFRTLGLN